MVFQPADWAEAFSITVDHTKINEDLEDFPVLITLTSGTGLTSFNANNIFDSLEGNTIDEYDMLIFRSVADSSNEKHSFRLDGGIVIEEPGYGDFEIKLNFDGTTNANMQIGNSNAFNIEIGENYTMEFWHRSSSSSAQNALHFGLTDSDNLVIRFNDSHAVEVYWDSDGTYRYIRSGTAGDYADGLWRHFAFVKEDQFFKLYVQGIEVGRAPAVVSLNVAGSDRTNLMIFGASNTTATYNLNGSLSGIRVSKTDRYLEGFTPPTSSFINDEYTVFLIQDKLDYSDHQYNWTIGNTSTYPVALLFNSAEEPFGRTFWSNNGQVIYTEDNLDNFQIGEDGESFTVDCWCCVRVTGNYPHGFCGLSGDYDWNSGGRTWSFGLSNDIIYFQIWNGATSATNYSFTLATDTHYIFDWNHYAAVNDKEADTFKIYWNGMVCYSTSAVTVPFQEDVGTVAKHFCVGSVNKAGWIAYNAISELRVSKGAARWSANFEPPKAPYGSGSWHNRKKIAVTTTVSGVEEETFSEIDYWYDGSFYRQYHPFYKTGDNTYVNATSVYSTTYDIHKATYKWHSRAGVQTNGQWLSALSDITDQKFNVDLGKPIIADRLLLDNGHNSSGALRDSGIKNFKVYGTNSSTAFDNVTYGDTTDLTLMGEFQARQRWASWDGPDSQYFNLTNNGIAYRYYTLMIADNHGYLNYMTIRYFEFQQNTRKAKLYVKVPSVSSVSGTQLNVYYDKDQEDNIYQIGDTRDDIANYVWDDSYLGVWHLSQRITPQDAAFTTDPMLDSTSNDNHGDLKNTMYNGRGNDRLEDVWFNDTDYISFGNLGSASQGTIEFNMVSHSILNNRNPFTTYYNGLNNAIRFDQKTAGTLDVVVGNGTSSELVAHTMSGTENNISFAWSSTTGSGYGYFDDTPAYNSSYSYIPSTFNDVIIGQGYSTSTVYQFYGIIDEVRVSNIPRSSAWLKATYYSNTDNLLIYDVGQTIPYLSYIFSGTVRDWSGYLADIPVRLYRKSDGMFINEATTNSSGTFQVLATTSGEHYITAFHPQTDVNAVIYDKITPSGIIL